MRKLLALGFLLYDIIAIATKTNYGLENGLKRQAMLEDRQEWRKKILSKSDQFRDWDRTKHSYDDPKHLEDLDSKMFNGIDRQRDMDLSAAYKHRRFDDDIMSLAFTKSIENGPSADKELPETKAPTELNCARQHEKFESCFAGCASVTCDNPRERMQPCYPFCEAGCVCVHPYVRDDRTHKCVLPEDCTKGLKGIPDLGDNLPTL